jgi:aryl-alcohol dehydrogenase-like predicted oxidoreductase
VDAIDLYYLHRDDRTRPVEEIMETLHDLVEVGKLRYVACSNWCADRIAAAQAYAAAQGFRGFVADQMLWNLAVTDPSAVSGQGVVVMDEALHRLHAETEMAAVPFSSQAGGLFQKLASGGPDMVKQGLRRTYPLGKNLRRFERMQSLAAETGLTISQIVLGYLLAQPFVTVPIVGCKSQAHLRDTMDAAEASLSGEQVAYLQRESD